METPIKSKASGDLKLFLPFLFFILLIPFTLAANNLDSTQQDALVATVIIFIFAFFIIIVSRASQNKTPTSPSQAHRIDDNLVREENTANAANEDILQRQREEAELAARREEQDNELRRAAASLEEAARAPILPAPAATSNPTSNSNPVVNPTITNQVEASSSQILEIAQSLLANLNQSLENLARMIQDLRLEVRDTNDLKAVIDLLSDQTVRLEKRDEKIIKEITSMMNQLISEESATRAHYENIIQTIANLKTRPANIDNRIIKTINNDINNAQTINKRAFTHITRLTKLLEANQQLIIQLTNQTKKEEIVRKDLRLYLGGIEAEMDKLNQVVGSHLQGQFDTWVPPGANINDKNLGEKRNKALHEIDNIIRELKGDLTQLNSESQSYKKLRRYMKSIRSFVRRLESKLNSLGLYGSWKNTQTSILNLNGIVKEFFKELDKVDKSA